MKASEVYSPEELQFYLFRHFPELKLSIQESKENHRQQQQFFPEPAIRPHSSSQKHSHRSSQRSTRPSTASCSRQTEKDHIYQLNNKLLSLCKSSYDEVNSSMPDLLMKIRSDSRKLKHSINEPVIDSSHTYHSTKEKPSESKPIRKKSPLEKALDKLNECQFPFIYKSEEEKTFRIDKNGFLSSLQIPIYCIPYLSQFVTPEQFQDKLLTNLGFILTDEESDALYQFILIQN